MCMVLGNQGKTVTRFTGRVAILKQKNAPLRKHVSTASHHHREACRLWGRERSTGRNWTKGQNSLKRAVDVECKTD